MYIVQACPYSFQPTVVQQVFSISLLQVEKPATATLVSHILPHRLNAILVNMFNNYGKGLTQYIHVVYVHIHVYAHYCSTSKQNILVN